MERKRVNSSRIRSIGYDERNQYFNPRLARRAHSM